MGTEPETAEVVFRPNVLRRIPQLLGYLSHLDRGTDIVEICGGEGRVSTLAIRRHLETGANFDLITGWNLNDENQQNLVMRYLDNCQPLVVVMGPTCKPFGTLPNYNYWYNHPAWLRSYEDAAPLMVDSAAMLL